jgi:hypothetical protein
LAYIVFLSQQSYGVFAGAIYECDEIGDPVGLSYGATSIVIGAFHSISGSTISNRSNNALAYADLTFNAERKTRLLNIITEK